MLIPMLMQRGGKSLAELTYSHTEQTRSIMLKFEIFIREFGSTVDGTASRAVTLDEVTTLDHEIFNLESRGADD